jgi:hypothetical protein
MNKVKENPYLDINNKYGKRDYRDIFGYFVKRYKVNGMVPKLILKQIPYEMECFAYCDIVSNVIVVDMRFFKSLSAVHEVIMHEYAHYMVNRLYEDNDRVIINSHSVEWAKWYGRLYRDYCKLYVYGWNGKYKVCDVKINKIKYDMNKKVLKSYGDKEHLMNMDNF